MSRRVIAATLALLSISLSLLGHSSAVSQSVPGNGLMITPVRTNLTIDPGNNAQVPVYITNTSSANVTLQFIVNDFTAANESGTPSLILNGSNNRHGLKQFIAPIKNFTLAPKQQQLVKVNINIPKNTPGGGYYSAVRFAAVSSGQNPSRVSLSASVASLILVKVPGPGLSEQLNLANFYVAKNTSKGRFFFSSGKLNAVITFVNSGNVQEQPFGKVVVTSGSKTVMTKEINNSSEPNSVLPGTTRVFTVPLSGMGSIGKYLVSGYFSYGNSSQLLSANTTIYILTPWIIVIAIIVILAIIFAAWRLTVHFKKL